MLAYLCQLKSCKFCKSCQDSTESLFGGKSAVLGYFLDKSFDGVGGADTDAFKREQVVQ